MYRLTKQGVVGGLSGVLSLLQNLTLLLVLMAVGAGFQNARRGRSLPIISNVDP